MKFSAQEKRVLIALAQGIVLKSHRTIEGEKLYQLHAMDGSPLEEIGPEVMERLKEARLIDSNKKFPAASYLLTDRGREEASALIEGDISALGASNFGE
jgi:uncharacterized protein YjhX (UPF0386 family)